MENSNTTKQWSTSPEVAKIINDWFEQLQHELGDKARLRRCHTPEEVAFEPAFHRLRLRLAPYWKSPGRVAIIAGVLAHVKKNDHKYLVAEALALGKEGIKKPAFSEKRFKRLLKAQSKEDLFESFIRVVKVLAGNVNVVNLATGIFWWKKQRKIWA